MYRFRQIGYCVQALGEPVRAEGITWKRVATGDRYTDGRSVSKGRGNWGGTLACVSVKRYYDT